jgi:hypothetical protein
VGLPKATIIHRAHRASSLPSNDRETIIRFLTRTQDRRRWLTLSIPGCRVLRGGVNELIRRVVGQPQFERFRHDHIGGPAIKRRLLACDYSDLLWAFGFRSRQSR